MPGKSKRSSKCASRRSCSIFERSSGLKLRSSVRSKFSGVNKSSWLVSAWGAALLFSASISSVGLGGPAGSLMVGAWRSVNSGAVSPTGVFANWSATVVLRSAVASMFCGENKTRCLVSRLAGASGVGCSTAIASSGVCATTGGASFSLKSGSVSPIPVACFDTCSLCCSCFATSSCFCCFRSCSVSACFAAAVKSPTSGSRALLNLSVVDAIFLSSFASSSVACFSKLSGVCSTPPASVMAFSELAIR